jgi:hypothetical protein
MFQVDQYWDDVNGVNMLVKSKSIAPLSSCDIERFGIMGGNMTDYLTIGKSYLCPPTDFNFTL